MPSKRTLVNRERSPRISAETVRMFATLESTPPPRRKTQEFKNRDRELARRLGLGGEWLCSVVSVLDRGPCYRTVGSPQHEDWLRVRAVRLRLLAVAGMSEPPRRRVRDDAGPIQ